MTGHLCCLRGRSMSSWFSAGLLIVCSSRTSLVFHDFSFHFLENHVSAWLGILLLVLCARVPATEIWFFSTWFQESKTVMCLISFRILDTGSLRNWDYALLLGLVVRFVLHRTDGRTDTRFNMCKAARTHTLRRRDDSIAKQVLIHLMSQGHRGRGRPKTPGKEIWRRKCGQSASGSAGGRWRR